MAAKIDIWNRALANIGVKLFVQSETEKSNEAAVLNVHWDAAVEKLLVDHPWPFARAYRKLALVEVTPNLDWEFSYRYPSDCLMVRRILTRLGRVDPNPPPFVTGQDDQGRLIYTDVPEAQIEYTKRVTEPERFDVAFENALVWYLSFLCAPSLSRVDGIIKTCYAMYKEALSIAAVKARNEGQQDQPLDAEWIRVR